jgi:hypothetical protein
MRVIENRVVGTMFGYEGWRNSEVEENSIMMSLVIGVP